MLGSGTHRRKVVNRERSQLPRPNSEYELNETEEDQYNLDNLNDDEVCKIVKFLYIFNY